MIKIEFSLISPINPKYTKIEQILFNRGISNFHHFLNTSEKDILSPTLIKNIRDGVKMLIKHISNNDKIYIQVDEDCDGYTSAALLINYLNTLFPYYVKNFITYDFHPEKQHGVIVEQVKEDIKLVIILDAGSNQFEEHKILKDRGIDILIIDHHEAEEITKDACIINNQLCDYPNKMLSGAGMVYKFCCYIDELLNINNAKQFEDLAALGCCGDMMDSRIYETREIMLEGFSNVNNPFFKAMINKQIKQFESGITLMNVAFYIVPYINAVTRVGSINDRKLIFDAMLETKANNLIPSTKRGYKGQYETVVDQAIRVCSNLKQTKQSNARDQGIEIAEAYIKNYQLDKEKILIIQVDQNLIDHNLNGLIANQLMAKYQRPVLMLQKYEDENGIYWAGSARGYSKCDLTDFKEFLNESGLVRYAQGHGNAFGVAIDDLNINNLKLYIEEKLKDMDFTPLYKVDFIYNIKDVKNKDIYDIADYNYIWGQNVDECLIAITDIKITSDNLHFLGASERTLRIDYGNLSFIKFFLTDTEKAILDPGYGQYTIDIVGKCNRNEWNGLCSPQIIIEDYNIKLRTSYNF